jgi:uncharacterized peroxidase-related enzyme
VPNSIAPVAKVCLVQIPHGNLSVNLMPRILALDITNAPVASQDLLNAVKKKIGMAPNLYKTLAHSPAALQFALGQNEALAGGSLSAALREQIALVTAGVNECDYCASAHTLLGKGAGLLAGEMAANLRGRSDNSKTQAALSFAAAVVTERGRVSDSQLQAVRAAGYGDAEVAEIVANVVANIFTNYFNHVAGTAIDFPVVLTKAPESAQA